MLTIRRQIIVCLEQEALDAHTLSGLLGIREKEVYPHLLHVKKSLQARGRQLVVTPYHCRLCGFTFKNREKIHPPGRCPQCKQGSIEPALFQIEGSRSRGSQGSRDNFPHS